MEQKIQAEFEKYLKKICRNKELRGYAKDFFVDFCSKYEGQFFTKDNFETLVVDGVEVEQDIVKHLFSTKEQATAGEVFLYLLKNNVQKIDFYTAKNDVESSSVGFLNSTTKNLGIKKKSLVEYYRAPNEVATMEIKPNDVSDKEWEKLQKKKKQEEKKQALIREKQAIEDAQKKVQESYKHTLYHELSHVFELKTFLSRQCIKNNMSNRVLVKDHGNKYVSVCSDEVVQEQVNIVKNRDKQVLAGTYTLNGEYFVEQMTYIGEESISEILNEVFACGIDDTLQIKEGAHSSSFKSKFLKKCKLEGECGYNINYDIATFIRLAVGDIDEKDLRFNSKKIKDKLKNLNIPKESLESIQERFAGLFKETATNEVDKKVSNEAGEIIMSSNAYQTLGMIMGMAQMANNSRDDIQNIDDYKIFAQEMLIESIKNDIVSKLNDPNVVKDQAFFESVNQTLSTIDSLICYPSGVTFFNKRTNDPMRPERVMVSDVEILSIEQHVEKHQEFQHLLAFNELIKTVSDAVNKHKKSIKNIEECVEFINQQQVIVKQHKELQNEDSLAIEEQKKAKQARMEEAMKRVKQSRQQRQQKQQSNTNQAENQTDVNVEDLW